ncbi:MAG TPA: hypothetical protein VGV12_16730 [Gemmatimonadales bacterium]|nr:hypothetical protein [Gemmatimonadales bacterium]
MEAALLFDQARRLGERRMEVGVFEGGSELGERTRCHQVFKLRPLLRRERGRRIAPGGYPTLEL